MAQLKDALITGDSRTIGRASFSATANQIITGTGTAAQDKGSGVSPRYFPAKWTFSTGLTAADGDIITIKLPVAGHDYGVFMSIDGGTNYYPVVLNGTSRLTTHFPVNTYITVIFEPTGSAASMFPLAGGNDRVTVSDGVWRIINYRDTNDNDTGYYLRRIYPNLKAGSNKIFPYTMIMQNSDGRWESIVTSSSTGTSKARNTHGFRLGNVLLMYANATYNENATVGTYNIWSMHSGLIDHRYSFNTANDSTNGTTGYKPVYIVGTINATDGLFYLDTTWWTQTLPSSDDGKLYIYIGDAYDYYRLTFVDTQKIYWYKNGAVREYAQDAATVTGFSVAKSVPSDAKFTDTTYESKAAASGGTAVSLVTTGEKYTWNNKTSNTGTVTSVATGAGLTGGTITTTGTIKCDLKSETKSTLEAASMGSTANKQYAVGLDKNGDLSVNIPWTDNNTTYSFTGGTNKFTYTPSGGSATDVTITPSITNNVTGSGTSGYLTKFNGANTITNGPQLGSSTTTYLRNDGSWVDPRNVYVGNTAPSGSNYDVWIDTSGTNDLTALINAVYPVGSIYMSINSTNPGTLFGVGTWEQIQERFLLGAGSTYTAGSTGGQDQASALMETFVANNNTELYWDYVQQNTTATYQSNSRFFMYSGHTGGQALAETQTMGIKVANLNNTSRLMPPYLAVYIWKRTA